MTSREVIKRGLNAEDYIQLINVFTLSLEEHREWIFHLLYYYYDPMYNHKLEKRKNYIVHRGDYKSCNNYIESNS